MEKASPPPYNESYPPPQAHYMQPQPSYAPPPMVAPQPAARDPSVHVTTVHVNTAQPQFGGTCPICHAGKFEGAFTLCGWLCCLFCFPCGIICCFCMRKKKCSHCGFSPS